MYSASLDHTNGSASAVLLDDHPHIIAPERGAGDRCSSDQQCAPGFGCRQTGCFLLSGLRGGCNDDSDCAGVLMCDPLDGVCVFSLQFEW